MLIDFLTGLMSIFAENLQNFNKLILFVFIRDERARNDK